MVRSRSYDVMRGTTFDKISAKSWENATWRGAIDLNGDRWCDWCQYMTMVMWLVTMVMWYGDVIGDIGDVIGVNT